MLNFLGWIDGLTASGVVVFGILFGGFFIYKSRKSNAKILLYLGLANAFAGLMFLGVFLDFLIVLITDSNINNTNGIVGILSYIWMAPAVITAIYIGSELLIPSKKWYWVTIFIILSLVFEFFIFLNPLGTFNFAYPINQLIDYNVNTFSMAGVLMAMFLLSIILLLGMGFLIKSFKSSGVIRRKFFLIALGSLCFCIFGLIEGLTAPGLLVIIVRIGYLSSFWFMYYGLKE
ncbi:MAG: hypothetical protein ACFE85_00675 [Candidatus Hodarchaeota archaeon]